MATSTTQIRFVNGWVSICQWKWSITGKRKENDAGSWHGLKNEWYIRQNSFPGRCSVSRIWRFVRVCIIRARIRGGAVGGLRRWWRFFFIFYFILFSLGNCQSCCCLFDSSFVFLLVFFFVSSRTFAPFFAAPQTFFQLWRLVFFSKKYISFVLSQYKNKAHCTYCSIGKKKLSFFSFLFFLKWLLFVAQAV